MKLTSDCVQCLLDNMLSLYSKTNDTEKAKLACLKDLMQIAIDSEEDISTPYLASLMTAYLSRITNIEDFYKTEKTSFNKLLLSFEHQLMQKINNSNDPLMAAIKYAMAGNYIDFGALKDVREDELMKILECIDDNAIAPELYTRFQSELSNASNLVYLADNAGEIVLDKLLVSVLKTQYPNLTIHFIVRGAPILNDVTVQDANDVGLTDIVDVYSNGTAIPGTCLDYVDTNVRELINRADLIVSKGQGNFESLYGCGLNIYYIFLCKCNHFINRFDMKKFQGIFINEESIHDFVES